MSATPIYTFSNAFNSGKRLKNWNTRPRFSALNLVAWASLSAVISIPPMNILPEVGRTSAGDQVE